jgi:hypothetical protein
VANKEYTAPPREFWTINHYRNRIDKAIDLAKAHRVWGQEYLERQALEYTVSLERTLLARWLGCPNYAPVSAARERLAELKAVCYGRMRHIVDRIDG